jgi:hypothetical protein
MGDLSLTVTLQGLLVGLLGESKRIEESNRRKSTRDVVNGEGIEGGGGAAGGGGGEGSGGAGKS